MYYYIFDIKKCRKRSQVENIKSYLGSLGISGEFTYPTAAQTVSELVELGLSKQYSTIVVVGGDEIASEVAAKLLGRHEAMGIIPMEASNELSALIGADNWKDACDILRYRKISETNLGKTASGSHFLTTIDLGIQYPVDITLELKDYIIHAKVKNFLISNFHPNIKKIGMDFLDIVFTSVNPEDGSILSKISSMFGSKPDDQSTKSLLRARSMRIFTKSQVPIYSHNTVIAKTPQLIESTDETLRLITGKKINSPQTT
jgi:hypothetical protein